MAGVKILRVNTDSIGIKNFGKLILLSIECSSKSVTIPTKKTSK